MPPKKKKRVVQDFQSAFGGDFDKMLNEMPTNFLECRDMKHSWRKRGAKYDASSGHYERTLGCTRCGATKTQLIGRDTGELLRVSGVRTDYDYPEGYLVKGVGRMTSADNNRIRLNTVIREIK